VTLVTVRHRPVIVTPAEGPKAAYDAAVRAALERGGVVVPGGARGPPGQELGEGLSIGRPAGDAVSPNRGRFTIERAVLDPPVVFDAAGRRTNLKPADVVGRIEMFGQHELAEVAQQKTSVAQMIEGFAGMPETSSGRQELLRKLADNRERLARAEADQSRLEDELADILRLEATVEQYRASDLPGKLEEQKRPGQDGSIFSEAKTRLGIASAAVSELANSDVVAQLVQVYEGADDSPQAAVLQRVRAATTKLSEEISAAQTALTAAVRAASTEIEEANAAWQEVTTPQREKHAEVFAQAESRRARTREVPGDCQRLGTVEG
jgi:hypothetical protein